MQLLVFLPILNDRPKAFFAFTECFSASEFFDELLEALTMKICSKSCSSLVIVSAIKKALEQLENEDVRTGCIQLISDCREKVNSEVSRSRFF